MIYHIKVNSLPVCVHPVRLEVSTKDGVFVGCEHENIESAAKAAELYQKARPDADVSIVLGSCPEGIKRKAGA